MAKIFQALGILAPAFGQLRVRSPFFWVYGTLLAFLALSGIWLLIDLKKEYDKVLSNAAYRATQRSQIISQSFSSKIMATDYVLRDVLGRLEKEDIIYPDPSKSHFEKLTQLLKEKADTVPDFFSIVIFDSHCTFTATVTGKNTGVRSKPEVCEARKRHHGSGPMVSYVPGTKSASGQPVLVLSRHLRSPTGDFQGGVMGVIELQIAQNWLNSLSLSPGDSVALLDESRTILARHPQIPKVSDNHIANFQIPAVLHAPTAEASKVAQSDIDGHERLLGFSKTENFPLIVAYGIDQSRMLEQWQWRTIELTVGYFFLLLLAGISARHQWTILRQKEELHSSEEHFRMLAENMADIVWRTDALLNFTYINRADQQTRGFSREEVIGTAVQESLTPQGQAILDTKLKDRRAIKMAAPPCVAFQYELPMRHKNGGQVWIEVSSVPIYGSDGNIKGYQGIGRDISERKRHEAQLLQSQQQLENQLHQAAQEKTALQELATRDPLTGLYNRRYLDATFLRELARSRREEQPLAVVMLDLDHFKQVNDQYGHAAGDEVLKALAQLLRQGARESDLIARYGGEEFVAIMPNMSAQQAWERVQSWRTQLEAMPIVFADLNIRVTLSAGIAIFPDHGQSPSQLLTRADEMLYQSKLAGRNQITLAALEPHGPLVDGSANPA